MYQNIRSRIVYNNAASDFFDCNNGVRQLENLSPFLFSMYLNDLEQFLNDRNVNGLTSITEDFESELDIYLKLFVLLYADDTVIMSESKEDMQNQLNVFNDFCKKWKLKVNAEKSKVLVFNNGRLPANLKFTYINRDLEIVPNYSYLGITFSKSFQYKYRVNLSGSTVQTSEQLVKSKSLEYVNNYAFLCIVMCILLIISGIEMNPGPSDSDLSSSFGSISSTSTTVSNFIHNSVSFLHLNIQSITPKLDLIAAEYSCHEILSFTESWLRPHVSDDTLKIPGYKFPPFRRDRVGKMGGGVVVFVKDHINGKHRPDLQIENLECIWLEIKIKNKKYLYGTFYIPPNSNLQTWDELDQSIDLALNNTHDIIITGDFNINQLSDNHRNKISSLLTQYSFQQLITEPTYMTEHSSSLLDLVMVNNPTSVLYTEVGPPC